MDLGPQWAGRLESGAREPDDLSVTLADQHKAGRDEEAGRPVRRWRSDVRRALVTRP